MGSAKVFRMKEKAVGCIVGRRPDEPFLRQEDRDESWAEPFIVGPHTLCFQAGDEFIDEHGALAMKINKGHEHFVRCTEESVARALNVPSGNFVRWKEGPNAGKLIGFYGLNYVFDDITHEFRQTFAVTGNRLQHMKQTKELQDKVAAQTAEIDEAKKREATLLAQIEELKKAAAKEVEDTSSAHRHRRGQG